MDPLKSLFWVILIAAMAPMLRRMIGEGITIELAVAPGLWPVFLDPAQLDQVIVNLCLNARDALGDRGRIAIAVDSEVTTARGI